MKTAVVLAGVVLVAPADVVSVVLDDDVLLAGVVSAVVVVVDVAWNVFVLAVVVD